MSEQLVLGEPHVIAVCGLALEARAAAGVGVAVAYTGNQLHLAARLREVTNPATQAIISFGFAGGLKPGVPPGTCVIATRVLAPGEGFVTDPTWVQRLSATVPTATAADLASVDHPLLSPPEKRGLHTRTGAIAVDMESHIAGRIARELRLPFAAIRVVLDPAERPVPKAALAGYRADGSVNAVGVLTELNRRPRDLPGVLRLAADAVIASRALLRCRRQLGERFAFMDIGEQALDVA